ncbi:hypothetical protein TSUD_228940 [Trifolium subterraneum]|uniref:Uncharacterized protein n=1 Tax=Trifolium subterraneum TaxID=3900 RepID=A0A2Z6LMJ0_TRISU|nr:hypothetical protein TSUD_228940 [Trifolium subterraneum]
MMKERTKGFTLEDKGGGGFSAPTVLYRSFYFGPPDKSNDLYDATWSYDLYGSNQKETRLCYLLLLPPTTLLAAASSQHTPTALLLFNYSCRINNEFQRWSSQLVSYYSCHWISWASTTMVLSANH